MNIRLRIMLTVVTLSLVTTVMRGQHPSKYLFAYFQGNNPSQEHLFYAYSNDALAYTPLNAGAPVVDFSTIARSGNIRDPFILRTADGTFLMVCTDMRSSNGWASNRGIVMSKSADLIHWTHSTVHFPERYAETPFANVTRVWAPEVIYDRQAGKYLIYYSILTDDGTVEYDKVFYNYANEDFTDLVGEPVHLYDRGSATIDLTIVYNDADNRYHAYYKNEGAGGICHISASTLTAAEGEPTGSQWGAPSGTVQQTTRAVEGPALFKRISDGKWILGYDCYTANPAVFQLCEVSDDFSTHTLWGNCANNGAFTPRHGSIIPVTDEELYQLDMALGGASAIAAQRQKLKDEITLAETLGCDVSEERVISNTENISRAELEKAVKSLQVKECSAIKDNYTYDVTSLLGSPTNSNIASNSGQHWDGSSTSIYYEQPSSSWSASSWSSSITYTASLPVGEYVLRVACRASSDVVGTISGNGMTQTIPTNGDIGFGITTAGITSFDSKDVFANNDSGRGWEWRYIPVTVSGATKTVKFTLAATTNSKYQWFSVTDISLLSKNAIAEDILSDEQNQTTTVGQVRQTVNITNAVDYKITGSTPFTTTGSVNIMNDDAVVIFTGLRPSAVISSWLTFVKINGTAAVNGTNCQVKIYGDGTIILPYGNTFNPLTVYKGNEWKGASYNKYTSKQKYNLSGSSFDNSIRSFTLKRGYSVCLSAKSNGLGYSRVWVADTKNIKVDLAGTPLDGTASFIRINQWNDVSKKGYAGASSERNRLLNTTWYYNWNDNGELNSPDREYVAIRQQPWWPSVEVGGGSNVLGYNEFDNTVEDSYKKLVEIAGSSNEDAIIDAAVNRWTDLLVTGKRLGSPCVSNYSNNFTSGMLGKFINKLEEKGYRCDYIVTHCYWYSDWSSWKSQLSGIHNDYPGRQIWITEMNYGANWTGWPGSGTSGTSANYSLEKQHFAPIIDGLESTDFIERYAVYNNVQECRYMFKSPDGNEYDNTLTPMGEYYANKASGIGYKADLNSYVPNTSKWMKNPLMSSVIIDNDANVTRVVWSDENGEYIKTMKIEVKSGSTWNTVYTEENILPEGGSYTVSLPTTSAAIYRIHTIDHCGIDRYSSEQGSMPLINEVGNEVIYDGKTYYVGGNVISNGDFNYGWQGWTDGTGNGSPEKSKLEILPVAGADNGTYLRAYGHTGVSGNSSFKSAYSLVTNQPYLFSVWHKDHEGGWQKASLSSNGDDETVEVINLKSASDWEKQDATFNSSSYSKFVIKYRWLNSTGKFDKFSLCRLFTTERSAYEDGFVQLQSEVEAFKEWNRVTYGYADINTELASRIAAASSMSHTNAATAKSRYEEAANALRDAYQGIKTKKSLDSLVVFAEKLTGILTSNSPKLLSAISAAKSASTVESYRSALSTLEEMLRKSYIWTDKTTMIQNPTFASASGWITKAGSYTGGDQRTNNVWGKTCWNAWWSTASEGTMEVKQTISELPAGCYVMSCVATTQPFCITDQHGYISTGTITETTPVLTFERFDAPGITDDYVWEQLTTQPVHLNTGGQLTIGFVGSKANKQTSNPVYSDNREGWWCATDFKLYHIILRGDLNHDGAVDISDVVILANHILGKQLISNLEEADVNWDESVDISDVVTLTNIILGKSE